MISQQNQMPDSKIGLHIANRFLMLFWVVSYLFIFHHPAAHLVMFGVLCTVLIYRRINPVAFFIPLLPILMMMGLFAGFSPPALFEKAVNKELIWQLTSSLQISRGGLFLGVTFVFRLMNMVLCTRGLFQGVHPDEVTLLMTRLKLPQSVCLTIGIAFRFIPEFEKKREQIKTAQRLRGAEPDHSSWIKSWLQQIKIMLPLIINAIIMAERLSIALYCRGLGFSKERTMIRHLGWQKKDSLTALMIITSFSLMIFWHLSFRHWVL